MIDKAALERNLWLLKLQRIDAFIFAGAVFVAFQMHTIGLSLTQILSGEAVFALAYFIFEIPTGVFSDLVSRKKTLFIAQSIFLSGVIVFAFAHNFTQVIISQILTGAGLATTSGTDSSMLYDTLKALGREEEHKKILGSITSFYLVTIALGQAAGSLLATINLRLPEIAGIPLAVATLIITFFLREPPREKGDTLRPFDHAWSTIRWLCTSKILIFLVLASALLPLAFKITLQTFNPYMEHLNMPIAYWGFLTGSFNLIAALVVRKAHAVEKRIGFLKSYAGVFALTVLGFILMARAPIFIAFLWPAIPWVLRPFSDVFFTDEINKRTSSQIRATVLSIMGSVTRILQVVALPIIGYVSDAWSLSTMYLMLAVFLFVASFIFGIQFLQSDHEHA